MILLIIWNVSNFFSPIFNVFSLVGSSEALFDIMYFKQKFFGKYIQKIGGKIKWHYSYHVVIYRHISRLQWDKTLKAVVIDNPRPINLEVSKWSGKIRIRRKVTKEALKYIIRRRLRVLNAIISNFNMQFNPK